MFLQYVGAFDYLFICIKQCEKDIQFLRKQPLGSKNPKLSISCSKLTINQTVRGHLLQITVNIEDCMPMTQIKLQCFSSYLLCIQKFFHCT